MKKKCFLFAVLLCVTFCLGCQCEHTWKNATCTEPKICTECGETESTPLGHNWKDATCTVPRKCSICHTTTGSPLGHDWEDATCEKPKHCLRCDTTEGEVTEHRWTEATWSEPTTCSVCAATVGRAISEYKISNDKGFCLSAEETMKTLEAALMKFFNGGYMVLPSTDSDGIYYCLSSADGFTSKIQICTQDRQSNLVSKSTIPGKISVIAYETNDTLLAMFSNIMSCLFYITDPDMIDTWDLYKPGGPVNEFYAKLSNSTKMTIGCHKYTFSESSILAFMVE